MFWLGGLHICLTITLDLKYLSFSVASILLTLNTQLST